MAQAQTIIGTWDELSKHASEFQGKMLQLTIIADEPAAPQSLADFLGDFIGSIEGSGTNNSEDTGQKFGLHLVEKHQEHRL